MADSRRFKVTGDVHLLLLDDDEILFGLRQNTGFETAHITHHLGILKQANR